jgi:hypothetical protein
MLEALLPGGTLLALLLFLYRGWKLNSGGDARRPALGVQRAAATPAGSRERTDETPRAVNGRYRASSACVRIWPV